MICLLKNFLCLFLIALTCIDPIHAADISADGFASSDAREIKQGLFGDRIKIIRITGEIAKGDAEKIRSLIRGLSHDINAYRVELDSSGGNFQEAIEIAFHIHEHYGATYVGPGAECLSACAIIFMAGSIHNGDGNRLISRTMHVDAEVGFHAPFVSGQLPEKVPGALVKRAYEQALKTTAEFLRLSATIDWPNSLTRDLLLVSPSEFIRIDRVDRAGRWGVLLDGIQLKENVNQARAFEICRNHFSWEHERRTRQRVNAELYGVRWDAPSVARATDGSKVFKFPAEMGTNCQVTVRGSNSITVELDGKETFFVSGKGWHGYPSSFKLKNLPRSQKVSRISPTRGLIFVSEWDHNGSLMKFTRKVFNENQVVRIEYLKPRAGLQRVGVSSGQLLFEGKIVGNQLVGAARIFRKQCSPATYQVAGQFESASDFNLLLLGYGLRWVGASCETEFQQKYGVRSGRLIFRYLRGDR